MALIPKTVLYVFLISNVALATGLQAAEEVFLREDFETLDAWEPLYFRGIDRHTAYTIEQQEGSNVLVARSSDSASAMVHKQTFNVAEFPILHWRWKVDNVYDKGTYRLKSGDDYPIRVYILFAYDPDTAGFGMKIKYELAKALYGRYPPHSSLNYIWTSRPEESDPVASPFTDRSIMIPLRHGSNDVGRWVEETVNVLEDFKRIFGGHPPAEASLAVMNDSDNTGESATSYIQFIEVRKSAPGGKDARQE